MSLHQKGIGLRRWLDGAEGRYNELGLDPWVCNWFLILPLLPIIALLILLDD